jgi:hypothetical protein
LAACGARTSAGSYVGDDAVAAVAAQLDAEGRVAYYLGPKADKLALTGIDRVTENGPDFQVFATYGSCSPAMFDEGGCMDPMSVDTMDWRSDLTGSSCQRLEPQLGVPAGLVMGELILFTQRTTVRVLNAKDLADYDGHRGLALLPMLRRIGDSQPVGMLPPPDPELAKWVDELCGTVPGATVEHPIEEAPGALDNTDVPDFTVEQLGGGRLAWSELAGTPVVVAVGELPQVVAAMKQLGTVVTASPHQVALVGLVAELQRPKGDARPIDELEDEVGQLPGPVGYAAEPLPAVWFFDSASNTGQVTDGWDSGLIAFVNSSGAVSRYAPMNTPTSELQAATDGLN